MSYKGPSKPPPAPARQNVVPIHKLPRHIERLTDAHAIAWILEATQTDARRGAHVPAPPRA